MARKVINYIKLGFFVITGLAFLILILYYIGKNQNLFGKTFLLKAHFEDVHGLMPGNNIRYAGIDAGSVKEVSVIDDSTIEVTFMIKAKMKEYIHKNATVSISTDGLMGNKLINIKPSRFPAPPVVEGDILRAGAAPEMDEIMRTLGNTAYDVTAIAKGLRQTVDRLNSSRALWAILNDESLPGNLKKSLYNVKLSSESLRQSLSVLELIVSDVNSGKGSIGKLLKDTSLSTSVLETVSNIKKAGFGADSVMQRINALVLAVDQDIKQGDGPVNALLKNKEMTTSLQHDLENIEKATQSFNEVMNALKSSFLFRGYFKKQARQKNSNY